MKKHNKTETETKNEEKEVRDGNHLKWVSERIVVFFCLLSLCDTMSKLN